MPDPSSQANELRLLEQKRLRARLTPEEEARRVALAAAVPAQAPRGFDVNAAAAEVRALRDASAPTQPELAAAEIAPPRPVAAPPVLPAAPVIPAHPVTAEPAGGDDTADTPAALLLGDAAGAGEDPARAARVESPADPVDRAAPLPLPDPVPAEAVEPEPPPDAPMSGWASVDPSEPVAVAPAAADGSAAPESAPIVYDAAAYGLDPNDPDAVAWAAWYAEQGWDPATAYAYAQQMNAQNQGEASEVAASEPIAAADVPLETLETPETPRVDAAPAQTAADAADAMPDLPPLELEALDGTADEATHVAVSDPVPVDLGPAFDPEPPPSEPPAPRQAAPPLEGIAAFAPGVSWAEHALPASDEPVDFTAFDAEPAMEVSLDGEELPLAELPAVGEVASPDAPPLTEEGAPPPETAPTVNAAGSAAALETDLPELIEVADDDILEVGEDVVEFVEPAQLAPAGAPAVVGDAPPEAPRPVDPPIAAPPLVESPAPECPALDPLPFEPPPDEPSGMEPPPSAAADAFAVSEPEAAPPPSPAPEPTLMLGAVPGGESFAAGLGPALDPEPPATDAPFAADEHTPVAEPEPTPEPEPPVLPESCVRGTHRVVIHTADGQVRRGTVTDVALDAGEVLLTPQGARAAEPVAVEQIKAIFFMLPPGQTPAGPEGKKVRVTFRDGRQVAGFSADYDPERAGFFMVPADTRTHTARIWVYRSAVRQVSVS